MEIKRKHKALTFEAEKRILDFIAGKIFKYVTADMMSLLALLGALLASISYLMTDKSLIFLQLASLGIFFHWFGDSLDGRVARLRHESRPKYGHYLDHILDAVSITVIIFGIGYSQLTMQAGWVWLLAILQLLMIHSYLKASATGIFELSVERLGPTELRILLICINSIIFASKNPKFIIQAITFTLFDIIGILLTVIMLLVFIRAVSSALWGKDRIRENTR